MNILKKVKSFKKVNSFKKNKFYKDEECKNRCLSTGKEFKCMCRQCKQAYNSIQKQMNELYTDEYLDDYYESHTHTYKIIL